MATNDNLGDLLTSVANAIRTKKGTTDPINAQDFASEIESIESGSSVNKMKNYLDVKNSCVSMFSGMTTLTREQLDTMISENDTENVTSMASMFQNCGALTTIPNFNTSKVTVMSYMFESCYGLTSVPLLDTSKVTVMNYMFQYCRSLTTIPALDTSKVVAMPNMFKSCSFLKSVPALDTSKVTSMSDMFVSCTHLEEIHMTGMKVSFSISASTLFTQEALVEILNNLATVTTTQTLTMGATNLAKLTDEEKAIATNKGWTLA